jgi:hypothetical protein
MAWPARLDRMLVFAAHAPGTLWDAVAQAILALGHVRPQSS